jgi:putative selenate reductase
MSDTFHPLTMEQLCEWIFGELERDQSIFGVPRELFFHPRASDRFRTSWHGEALDTPFGVAAGPHSQLAGNIVMAWLCGARFIELKTVQTRDDLAAPRPSIDMQDAGFHVTGSQELRIDQSIAEYQKAWVLIHTLHRHLGFPGEAPGVVFNLSVGYDLAGLQQPNMQRFLDRMLTAGPDLAGLRAVVARWAPVVRQVDIPSRISRSVTMTTRQGGLPAEMGRTCAYLLSNCGLHTTVKLSPTLLGPEAVRDLLNRTLGYDDLLVPDEAFARELKYPEALALIRELRSLADQRGLRFSVKLAHTLPVINHRRVFDARERTMHLSGRPLHALAITLAHRLAEDFEGALDLSFAGGADAFNAADLLACGLNPVTMCSDLLRAGGCTRLGQYLENTRTAMEQVGARTLEEFICRRAGSISGFAASACGCVLADAHRRKICSRITLRDYVEHVVENRHYHRDAFARARTKTARPLGRFDCIKAPCTDACPVGQKAPRYLRLLRDDRLEEAAALIREDNPLGAVLGRACHHPCQEVCIRTHYDEPLAIRELKRFIMDHETVPQAPRDQAAHTAPVAVIGAGPCGLAAAHFLGRAGYPVTVLEARPHAGGLVAGSLPDYRIGPEAIAQDLRVLLGRGVEVRYGQQAGRDFTLASLRAEGFAHVVLATGAPAGQRLDLSGEDAPGVLDALEFLRAVREQRTPELGRRVGVVGDAAMAVDCARTAWRLGADEVSVICRTTRREMPVQEETRRALETEGIPVLELLAPKAVLTEGGRLSALQCAGLEPGEPDAAGRRRPVERPGHLVTVPLDTLIVAVRQRADLGFPDAEAPALNEQGFLRVDAQTLETSLPGVFAGGDAIQEGPASIVKALGDGQRIAWEIRRRVEGFKPRPAEGHLFDRVELLRRRARRQFREAPPAAQVAPRRDFSEAQATWSRARARQEAARCLDCDAFCSFCVSTCPNLALFTYRHDPVNLRLPALEAKAGSVEVTGYRNLVVGQRHQVAVLADLCNECGNCTTFCPAAGRPHADKPRLYFNADDFAAQSDNAFRITRDGTRWRAEGRYGGELHVLSVEREAVYESPRLRATLDAKTLALREGQARDGATGPQDLTPCGELFILLRAVRDHLPWLPVPAA